MFGNLISQVLGRAAQNVETQDPTVDSLVRWLARLQIQVFGPWTQVGRSGITCDVRFRPHDSPRIIKCHSHAIAACIACGQSTCIEHALVAASGEVICRGCVDVAKRAAPPRSGTWGSAGSSGSTGDPRRTGDDYRKLRQRYLKRLGLSGSPTEKEVNLAYRKLAGKYHPDKFPPSRQKAAQKKFIALGEAKDWLLANLERKAA